MNLNKETKDAFLEFGRVLVLSILPVVIVSLETDGLEWKAALVAIVVAGLKAVDEYLHEKGKVEENENLIKGLTRF